MNGISDHLFCAQFILSWDTVGIINDFLNQFHDSIRDLYTNEKVEP